jgi:hypothetical protein
MYSGAELPSERVYDGERGGTRSRDVEQLTVRSMHAAHDGGPCLAVSTVYVVGEFTPFNDVAPERATLRTKSAES